MNKNTIQQVVLVDDDPDYVFLVEQAFSDCTPACNLNVVPGGSELFTWLEANSSRPHMILLDINMPASTGFDVLRTLRSVDRYKLIPVVMLTVSDRRQDIAQSYAIGANAYLVKPMEFSELKRRLNFFAYYWFDLSQTPGSSWDALNWYSELN